MPENRRVTATTEKMARNLRPKCRPILGARLYIYVHECVILEIVTILVIEGKDLSWEQRPNQTEIRF
jgi:hypothetical protein